MNQKRPFPSKGNKFGPNEIVGTVVRKVGWSHKTRTFMKLRCSLCGNEKVYPPSQLLARGSRCTCLRANGYPETLLRAEAHIGETHNNWKIEGISKERTSTKEFRAIARCLKCGNLGNPWLRHVISGKSKSCRPCAMLGRHNVRDFEATYNAFCKHCIRKRRIRRISFEQYVQVVAPRKCLYCGGSLKVSPRRLKRLKSSASYCIDQFVAGSGYILGNCVPCCTPCNRDKSDMNSEEWKKRLIRLFGKGKALRVLSKVESYLTAQKCWK